MTGDPMVGYIGSDDWTWSSLGYGWKVACRGSCIIGGAWWCWNIGWVGGWPAAAIKLF